MRFSITRSRTTPNSPTMIGASTSEAQNGTSRMPSISQAAKAPIMYCAPCVKLITLIRPSRSWPNRAWGGIPMSSNMVLHPQVRLQLADVLLHVGRRHDVDDMAVLHDVMAVV